MNRLYLVHDEDYNYQVVVSANSANSAIEKLQNFIKETKQTGEFWIKLSGLLVCVTMIRC